MYAHDECEPDHSTSPTGHVIEALDELGIRPVAIAGSSIGAIMGAGMAAGMTGSRELLPPISLDINAVAFLPVYSSMARRA